MLMPLRNIMWSYQKSKGNLKIKEKTKIYKKDNQKIFILVSGIINLKDNNNNFFLIINRHKNFSFLYKKYKIY